MCHLHPREHLSCLHASAGQPAQCAVKLPAGRVYITLKTAWSGAICMLMLRPLSRQVCFTETLAGSARC